MSADNWTYCPKCAEIAETELEAERAKVADSYGVVSAEEYARMLEEIPAKPEMHNTFREDYEIGVVEGVFEVNYRGSCHICGLKYSYKRQENVPIGHQ